MIAASMLLRRSAEAYDDLAACLSDWYGTTGLVIWRHCGLVQPVQCEAYAGEHASCACMCSETICANASNMSGSSLSEGERWC